MSQPFGANKTFSQPMPTGGQGFIGRGEVKSYFSKNIFFCINKISGPAERGINLYCVKANSP